MTSGSASYSYYAMKNEALASELSHKTSREEAAFKASLAPLARSHWSEIKHGAAAEELKSSLRVGMASVAAHSVASGASRESESCALLVELAANEMKAWKEATAETSAENAVANNKATEALLGKGHVVGADVQVRRILTSRKRAKTKSRVTKAFERSSTTLQRQENMELDFECAVIKCYNVQHTITAKHQRLKNALLEFDRKTKGAVPSVVEEGQCSVKHAGDEAIMALKAEISAMVVEEKSDKQKLSVLEIKSQANCVNLNELVTEFVNAAYVLSNAIDDVNSATNKEASDKKNAAVGCDDTNFSREQ